MKSSCRGMYNERRWPVIDPLECIKDTEGVNSIEEMKSPREVLRIFQKYRKRARRM